MDDRLPYFGVTSSDDPFLIVTADTRFPRGTTLTEQIANPGDYYVIPTEDGGAAYDFSEHFTLPGRGTWRWSYYYYLNPGNPEHFEYWFGIDFVIPLIKFAELNLLRAEALLETGNTAGAAAIVDITRTAHGLDASGDGNDACVPKLPNGSCGDLMEMLKWEKRLETLISGPIGVAMYFDSRRWGDLYRGTTLQFPAPCQDMEILQLACETYGGVGGTMSSSGSSYGYPTEG